jgi:hypothetical protein
MNVIAKGLGRRTEEFRPFRASYFPEHPTQACARLRLASTWAVKPRAFSPPETDDEPTGRHLDSHSDKFERPVVSTVILTAPLPLQWK